MSGETRTVSVDLAGRGYDIVIGHGLLAEAGARVSGLLSRPYTVIVTDDRVDSLHGHTLARALGGAGVEFGKIVLPPGEQTKSWAQLEKVVDRLLDAGVERGDTILAMGGGVVGDLAGFAAAILRRGVCLIQIPTTFLAQVDSSVGGKTGINTRHGKNLVGAFHQPRLVLADVGLLATLDDRQFRAGYAEVVKYGLIDDPAFFAWLEANGESLLSGNVAARLRAVEVSCRAKARIVALDEREAGTRALLNLGHTFGHALERAAGYGDLLHGEAVAIGMVMAFDLSARLGLCAKEDAARVREHLSRSGLAVNAAGIAGGAGTGAETLQEIIAAMGQDKKVIDGNPTLVLARGIGDAFLSRDVGAAEISALIQDSLAA